MSKKIFTLGLLFVAVAMAGSVGAVTPPPEQKDVLSTAAVELGPTRYPEFTSFNVSNGCTQYLSKNYKNGGLSLENLWVPSKMGNGTKFLAQQPARASIPGLSIVITIPEEYRSTAKITGEWSVVIVGTALGAYPIWPQLCSPFDVTSAQTYAPGEVETYLYANGVEKGKAIMTIPVPEEGGSVSITQIVPRRSSDPTAVGSFVLSKDDFGGTFPAKVTLEVKWYNDTCMRVTSTQGQAALHTTTAYVTEK